MSDVGYWIRKSQFGRRSLLRSATVGAAGLAGAALIGCGGGTEKSPAGAGGTAAAKQGGTTPGNGAPAKVTRGAGADPKWGSAPINAREVVPGGEFRSSFTDTTRVQDPDIVIGTSGHQLMNDRLFYANGYTMALTPDLLESYEVSDPQGLEITLKLRAGIKTHNKPPVNGRVFTAKDVAYSINRKAGLVDAEAAKQYGRRGQFVGLTRAEAVDDRVVKIKMSTPNSSLFAAFADPRASMIPVEQDTIGYTDPMKFVGTGAWIYTQFQEGTREIFTANPDYYRSWDEGGRPGIKTHEKFVVADRASSLAAFIKHETSWMAQVQPQEEAQIKASVKDAQWILLPNNDWKHFAMNLKLPMFQDDRVRQAMQLAADYKALADPTGPGWLYFSGLFSPFPEALTPEEVAKLPGYNPDTKKQDIDEAVKRMAAAGFAQGEGIKFKWSLAVTQGLEFDMAVRLRDQWVKIFPKMEPTLLPIPDSGNFNQLQNSRTFEGRLYGHTAVPDAVIEARTYYHTSGTRNYQSFSKPWADEAIEKAAVTLKAEERKSLLRAFQTRYVAEGPPLLALAVVQDRHVFHAEWAGMDLVAGPWGYMSYGPASRWYWQTKKA